MRITDDTLALSVRQPWAWAIIHGGKDVENRSEGALRQIGDRIFDRTIVIHAAQTMTRRDYENGVEFMARLGVKCPEPSDLDYGGFIGSARVVDVVSKSKSRWFGGPYGIVLADPKPCRFRPAKGQQGLFYAARALRR